MTTFDEVLIKEEVSPEDDYILVEDDIKVEETCLQSSDEATIVDAEHVMTPPARVIIAQEFLVCSICKCIFQPKKSVKLRHESDLYKCYKCILHSKLSQVFGTKKTWKEGQLAKSKQKQKEGSVRRRVSPRSKIVENVDESSSDDVIFVESNDTNKSSILVKKLMYICSSCEAPFERRHAVGLRDPSDWYKCNKCVLHSRLNTVFRPGNSLQGAAKQLR